MEKSRNIGDYVAIGYCTEIDSKPLALKKPVKSHSSQLEKSGISTLNP